MLGRELGHGWTAKVYEAFAKSPVLSDHDAQDPAADEGTAVDATGAPLPGLPRVAALGVLGRSVALKKFDMSGTVMFRQEVNSLFAAGVHPHILRLLEVFEGEGEGSDGDALVLEFCEGGDLYDLYAKHNRRPMPEDYVTTLLRQLLLALEHLARRRVEHRDVKPENLLLCAPSDPAVASSAPPHLKLADFGWAALFESSPPKVQAEGVGSLWYAPPELNPVVQGVSTPGVNGPARPQLLPGRSDMWSAGVIAYLLLVGHSPFNLALRLPPEKREAEVLRLAALGQVNARARAWTKLSQEARNFVYRLIRPEARDRLSAREALEHPFMLRARPEDLSMMVSRQLPALNDHKRNAWAALDGLQRLAWLAVARAVAEPELIKAKNFAMLMQLLDLDATDGYNAMIAMELNFVATPAWFELRAAWTDVIRLAFRYLDLDGDGLLGAADLSTHVLGENHLDITDAALMWVIRWQREGEVSPPSTFAHGLSFSNFRAVLWSTLSQRQPGHEEAIEELMSAASERALAAAAPQTSVPSDDGFFSPAPLATVDDARLDAIAASCLQFLEDEPDLSSFAQRS